MRNTNSVQSTSRITLLFQVQPQIFENYYYGWTNSQTWVAYVVPHDTEDRYSAVKDDTSFEIYFIETYYCSCFDWLCKHSTVSTMGCCD